MAKLFDFFKREPIILTGETTEEWVKMCKKKFNIDDYKGKYVMHCKTREEYFDFVKCWAKQDEENSKSYRTYDSWLSEEENYCLDFNWGTWASLTHYREKGYTILEWEDFMEKKEFTKEDLKSGDIITFRNNQIGLVFTELNGVVFNGLCGQTDLSSINLHLFDVYDSDWDIVKVQRPETIVQTLTKYWGEAPIIWEREETVEMTLAEVCKALGKNVKIVKE